MKKRSRILPNTWVEVYFDDSDTQIMLVIQEYDPEDSEWVRLYSPKEGTVYSVDYYQIIKTISYGLAIPTKSEAT